MAELDDIESEVKVGARNSRTDAARLQMIHDYAKENGAACDSEGKSIDDDALITFGDSVKALGGGRVGGYLVKFSTAHDPDLSADYFTPQTDYGTASASPVLYHHGLDLKVGKRVIGDAALTRDDVGIWAEAQLKLRDDYERAIYKLAEAGKLGWSSGTASHLVERKATGHVNEITRWPLGLDASLTPTPAEPRNGAIALKTYRPTMLDIDATPQAAQDNRDEAQTSKADADQSIKSHEVDTMSDEALKRIEDALTAQAVEIASMKKVIDSAPVISEVKAASVTVTSDPADVPFKSLAENLRAVKDYTISNGRSEHPRLTHPAIKAATGANETVPADGGFLLDPTLTSELLKPMHEEGPFTSRVRRLPVGNNSNYGWINGVDETDRATGSRWGGITGYRLAEAGTKTPSQPKFRRINWELKKYAVYCYGTDELLQDVQQFAAIVRMGASEELSFMANDDILNGNGTGGPVGILTIGNPALVTVTKAAQQAHDTIVYENCLAMWQRLPTRSKANATWFYNVECLSQLLLLSHPVGTAALPARFVDFTPGGGLTIFGRPAIENEFSPALSAAGDLSVFDLSEYLFWEKGGVQEAMSIHVAFVTDQTVFRFVARVEGKPAWAAPLTPYKGTSNTLSPFVALGAR